MESLEEGYSLGNKGNFAATIERQRKILDSAFAQRNQPTIGTYDTLDKRFTSAGMGEGDFQNYYSQLEEKVLEGFIKEDSPFKSPFDDVSPYIDPFYSVGGIGALKGGPNAPLGGLSSLIKKSKKESMNEFRSGAMKGMTADFKGGWRTTPSQWPADEPTQRESLIPTEPQNTSGSSSNQSFEIQEELKKLRSAMVEGLNTLNNTTRTVATAAKGTTNAVTSANGVLA
jgi:hypothetical protein